MKIHLFSFIVVVVCFLALPELEKSQKYAPYQIGLEYPHLKKPRVMNAILSSDYQSLSGFSDTMKGYGISQENFRALFWEGLVKAHNFLQSPKFVNQVSVNQIIKKELLTGIELRHPLKNPESTFTTAKAALNALNTFSGEWHGNWENLKVNHLWLPVRNFKVYAADGFSILGFQSCFTGDGFGWNYIVKEKNRILILGFVYHFNSLGKITSKNPHYAFLNPNNQLTWVSDSHIYYEFICKNASCGDKKHYVITGGKYKKQYAKSELVSRFQAVYVSQNTALPAFHHIN